MSRVGEIRYNNFGSKMKIIQYYKRNNIDVYFEEYDCIVTHRQYTDFVRGTIQCPYEPRLYNVGYMGEGIYKTKENGKHTKCYNTWHNMIKRCYDKKYQQQHTTYQGCTVCEEWHNFQNFAQWYEENYYEITNEEMCLDKDILCKGNKNYTPLYCIFVPQNINKLFTKSNKKRGQYPIGVYYNKQINKFRSQCNNPFTNKKEVLGTFSTSDEAFQSYKIFKENIIKQMATQYYSKDLIPFKLYQAMCKYNIEIID